MTAFTELQARLRAEPQTWLVTGVAGFIGSNLLEALLALNQRVVGLDNFPLVTGTILMRCKRWCRRINGLTNRS